MTFIIARSLHSVRVVSVHYTSSMWSCIEDVANAPKLMHDTNINKLIRGDD